MRLIDVEQGSAEWRAARAGRITASRISHVLSRARDRKSEGATRRNYKAQLIAERLTGNPQEDTFTNRAIEDGKENEPFGRAAYEVRYGMMVETVGLVLHPKMDFAAASPDGLVGADGLMQIKCPYPATHIASMLTGEIDTEYQVQMLWEMACAERAWCDFVSYCPILPQHLQLHVVRFPRDAKRITEITAEVIVFNREVDEIIERLNRKAA